MTQMASCEHCGAPVAVKEAELVVVEDWSHYFCSERCKLQWSELVDLGEEEE